MNSVSETVSTYFLLGLNYDEILAFLILHHNLNISKSTLKRYLRRMNLYRKKCFTAPETLLNFIRMEVSRSGQLHGYKWMHLKCLQAGLTVTHESVRLALLLLDPEGVDTRKKMRLRRRQYFNKGPNFLWHVDGYDKLKPYGIAINGSIDGFSRKLIWLRPASTNNDPAVIGGYFIEAIKGLGGIPQMIRCDMGTENRSIEQIQRFFAEINTQRNITFLYGRSTANQRIEAWWGILRKHSADFWINLFQDLKNQNMFDGSFLDKSLIQFCFMDNIQNELGSVCLEWDAHRITKSRNSISPTGKPTILYELPEIYGTKDYAVRVGLTEIDLCEEECKFPILPCDEDVYNVCILIMDEKNLDISNDP